jgi:hypothetical protein
MPKITTGNLRSMLNGCADYRPIEDTVRFKKMKRLGERNYTLLSHAVKITGNWVDAYFMIEEKLYVHEGSTIFRFCDWLDEEYIAMGHGNYEDRFATFLKYPG